MDILTANYTLNTLFLVLNRPPLALLQPDHAALPSVVAKLVINSYDIIQPCPQLHMLSNNCYYVIHGHVFLGREILYLYNS